MCRTLPSAFLAAVLLVLSLGATNAAAQDRTTLNGEPALRFLIGHGHLTTYCDGVLWITPTRVRFEALNEPKHAFDLPRSKVSEVKTAHSLGFDYVKLQAAGNTYRLGVYPTIGNSFGNRFEFLVRAISDFEAASREVERAQATRTPEAGAATLVKSASGPVLRFPVFAGQGHVWMFGMKKAVIFEPAELGDRAYNGSTARSWGWLEVFSDRIRFRSERGPELSLDRSKSDFALVSGAGGYPRIKIRDNSGDWFGFVVGQYTGEKTFDNKGQETGERYRLLDAAALLQALGDGFSELVARMLPKPVLLLASNPAGAEVYLNDERKGATAADGMLKLSDLAAGEYRVVARLKGYEDWAQTVRLEPGAETKLEANLVALPPPPPPPPPKPAGPLPFTARDVVDMLQGAVSPRRVGTLVQQRGVDFALTDDIEKQIRAAGGDDALLLAIAKAKR